MTLPIKASSINQKKAALTMCFLLILTVFFGSFSATITFRYDGENLEKIDGRVLQSDGTGIVTVVIQLSKKSQPVDVDYNFGVYDKRVDIFQSQSFMTSFLVEKGATVINTFWLGNYILANVSKEVLYEVSKMDFVERVFPNFEVTILDGYESGGVMEVAGSNVTWGLDRIGAQEVWNTGFNGSGVRVCVIDTGVDVNHPDIAGKMWTDNASDPTYPGGWIEFDKYGNIVKGSTPHDTQGHGTHVSGTIVGGNASGVAIGVAPASKLMHVLALPGGRGTFAQCVAAMQWAIEPFDQYGRPAGRKADVVSMSWGSEGYIDLLIEPILKLKEAGIVPVAAIGNSGKGSSCSPGNVYQSFGVGAIDVNNAVPKWSSGEIVEWQASYPEPYVKPDFSAPGVNVYSSLPSGKWGFLSGTSMATPHVAGTVALMLQSNPKLTVDDVYYCLKVTANDLGDIGQDIRYGWGVVNASAAVDLASANCGVKGYVLDATSLQATDWGSEIVAVSGRWSRSVKTDIMGYYSMFLAPGVYTLTAIAYGYESQNITVHVDRGNWLELNFSLNPLPMGYIQGTVFEVESNETISNATITVIGTPIEPVKSDVEGHYKIKLPVGLYDVDAWAWGYRPSIEHGINVSEDKTVNVNFWLKPTVKVAVIGDFKGQVTNLLMRNISAREIDWENAILSIQEYDVVIINAPSDPGRQAFLNLINAADEAGVSLIFTNTWPGPICPFGISLLQKYTGDPKGSYHPPIGDDSYYEVKIDHPIFDGWGVGEKIHIINGGWKGYAWFYEYSGITIADIGTNKTGLVGSGVAYSVRRNGNVHLLLAGLSQCGDTNIQNAWTENAKKIFIRAVLWASKPKSFLPKLGIDPHIAVGGSYVHVQGSGFAPKRDVNITLNGTLVLKVSSDFNGSFDAFLRIPVAGSGLYIVKAVDSFGNSAVASVKVFGDVHYVSLKAGWNLVGLSLDGPVNVDDLIVYHNGEWLNWTEACARKIVLGYIYWWNGSYLMVYELEPGKGYWMYAYKPCEIHWYVPENKG